jgi:CheY-like chemotaxis protein
MGTDRANRADPRPVVLVVEDEPADAKLFRVLLEAAGYAVRLAGSAAEALAALEGPPPRLVILDHHLPGPSGLELAARLKQDARTRGIPILVVSGSAGPEAGPRAAEAGCDGFLPKPLNVRTFSAEVARLAGRGGALET